MESFVVYILWSDSYSKSYIGYTSNLISRFQSHNLLSKKGWTIKYRPWRVVFVRNFELKREAMLFEKFLKSGVGREWIVKNVRFN
ncbi:GIY-YIG nuclease family protein [Rasiella rasia]|uniref:GIY-YIG nuclease family protein n=1 Tax=Rasiella rasia TaxID=2744027 RepID=A0A6G6GLK7_9FLAO|nr:GIY-YIG nuclease family protein [Rasiella rasia]QIE59293.1 GIY-YIG nuclease family protein [Rasiella rasia]QIE59294.1 GIY-YIG nuclease family protein [Rasiella rasia]QIE59295.1 GIY-YIG nuclease family protein [Rasiella rasia]